MPTNHFLNFFPEHVTEEQPLIEDLVIESLKIHSMDVFYLPRESRDQIDSLMGEDQLKRYTSAYPIEMYMENTTSMEGEGDLITKFGLEIRDEMTLLVARRRFQFTLPTLLRPREGDIIYVPLLANFFELTFAEHENNQAMMYTLGRGRGGNVYVYSLRMKQYVFSHEKVDRDPVRWWDQDDGWRIGSLCRWCHEEVKNVSPKPDDFAYHLTNEACDVEDTDEDTELVWDK